MDLLEVTYILRVIEKVKPDEVYTLAVQSFVWTSFKEFVEEVFKYIDADIIWSGEGAATKGTDRKTGKVMVEVSPEFYRPAEVDLLIGNSGKAKKKPGWEPKVKFN